MDVRKAALESLIKIIEKKCPADDILSSYSARVLVPSELSGLVSGVMRHKLTIDFFIENISTRKIDKLSYPVRNVLRLGIYELEYSKNPDYAVLNSYVELIKQYESKSSSFINGVLRNFLRKKDEIKFPDINEEPVCAISIKYSHPAWLVLRWLRNYCLEDTVEICRYNNLTPKLVLRINTLKISKEELEELFIEHEISFSEEQYLKECLIVRHHGKIEEIPGFHRGFWIVQSESSSLVAHVLDPKEGERILDLCAAPGGKTTHIAALTSNKSRITAIDISKKRIEKIKENCKRLGIHSVKTEVADATKYQAEEKFDRVLIDAPCSNTGVLAKRIDARWNKTPDDIKKLAELQLEILNNAATLVKSGGIMVYSTCSIEPEENQQVIEKFLKNNKDFKLDKIAPYLPWEVKKDTGYFQILQARQHIDGFFIARLKKK